MATPRKPVRHGRERPAPKPLPTRAPPAPGTTPDTTAPLPTTTTPDTTAPLPSGTTTTTTDTTAPLPSGTTTPLVIRVVYEPLGSLVEVEVRLTYEDAANGYSQDFTLGLRAADGHQERAITVLAPDPTHVRYRWSVRGFTSDGVVVESPSITAGDPVIKIDGSLQAALLHK